MGETKELREIVTDHILYETTVRLGRTRENLRKEADKEELRKCMRDAAFIIRGQQVRLLERALRFSAEHVDESTLFLYSELRGQFGNKLEAETATYLVNQFLRHIRMNVNEKILNDERKIKEKFR